jgi:hypothetical protein
LLQTQVELTRLFDAPVIIRPVVNGDPGAKVFGSLGKASFEVLRAAGFGAPLHASPAL